MYIYMYIFYCILYYFILYSFFIFKIRIVQRATIKSTLRVERYNFMNKNVA